MTSQGWARGVTLDTLLRAVSNAFALLLLAPAGTEVLIGSVMLVDVDDLSNGQLLESGSADLCLQVGVTEEAAVAWFGQLAGIKAELRPRAVMSKVADSPRMQEAARGVGVALVAVHAQTRWDSLLSTIRGLLDHSLIRPRTSPTGSVAGTDTDLFDLAHTVASLTHGMVSIEDDRSHVLAYSASDDEADELRKLSILGREGPEDYLRRLREGGVFDRLRRSDEVIEVPADEANGTRRRLVVSIRQPAGTQYGSIWVQEGARTLAPDSYAVLRGASAVAARLIARTINAPTNEAVQIQRLLGVRGGGVDVGSLAAALNIPTAGPAVVIGLCAAGGNTADDAGGAVAALSGSVRLHASAFARDSLVTTIDDRIYVLIPRVRSTTSLATWTAGMIERVAGGGPVTLRAALAAPVSNLGDVPAARREVDRVLDAAPTDQRVTTLADSRTPVLLGEILDLVATSDQLRDPRIDALLAYDERHASTIGVSVDAYLRHFGDVRQAAQQLQVHPNTLRYRVRRAEDILGIDLADPAARLLVEIQLGALGRDRVRGQIRS